MGGRQVVLLTGEIADPRSAYAAADVVVGQGGSALRGMAFGKPLIVVGEEGFSELLTLIAHRFSCVRAGMASGPVPSDPARLRSVWPWDGSSPRWSCGATWVSMRVNLLQIGLACTAQLKFNKRNTFRRCGSVSHSTPWPWTSLSQQSAYLTASSRGNTIDGAVGQLSMTVTLELQLPRSLATKGLRQRRGADPSLFTAPAEPSSAAPVPIPSRCESLRN